jgi:hypothetical protein
VFDTVLGLPVHALVVHGVVVLLPLMALVTIWWAWRAPSRPALGWLVVAADLAVAVMTWVAKQSGEALQARLGGLVAQDHAAIARWLPWVALALAAVAVLVQFARGSAGGLGMPPRVTAAVVTVVAAGAVVWTVRTGHSGSAAVWGGIIASTVK